jgi:hypothetical protein
VTEDSILIKGITHKKKITIVNLYVPNVGGLNFIKQTLVDLKAQTNTNTVIIGDFNTCLLPIYMSFRPKKKNQTRNFRIKWHHR